MVKKRHLLFGGLALSINAAQAQEPDTSSYKLKETEIEAVYNQYFQNGNNSAVTGGIGTEELKVYGPSIKANHRFGDNLMSFKLGSDVITAASTDNIDFVVSSASVLDVRFFADAGYQRTIEKKQLTVNTGMGFSVENDYMSVANYFGISKVSKDKMQEYSGQVQIYNDDLRWGRYKNELLKAIRLVYPVELRGTEWFDFSHRRTYNLNLAFTQILNKTNKGGLFAVFTMQEGLLTTPYHRVYFSDGSLAVENLPNNRFKTALTAQLNTFVKGNIVLKNSLNGYADNFGVLGLAFDTEAAVKLNPKWTLTPAFRFYLQKRSKYFKGFEEHDSNDEFYTSDYDLSGFRTYLVGFGVKFKPLKYNGKKLVTNSVLLRYNYFRRSNNLNGHMISLVMKFKSSRKKEKKS